MRDYKDEVGSAIEACLAAFADKSIYGLRAARDYHMRELEKLISTGFATREEEAEITRVIELIVSIDVKYIPECMAMAG